MSLFLQKIAPRVLLYLAEQKKAVMLNDISYDIKAPHSQISLIIMQFESEKLVSSSRVGAAKLVKLTKKGREAASCTRALMDVMTA